jgi:hypothetical protein
LTILLLGIVVASVQGQGQSSQTEQKILVELKIADVGSKEIDIIVKGNDAFVPVTQSFGFIGIKIDKGSVTDRLSGFFINGDSSYTIDTRSGTAKFGNNVVPLSQSDYLLRDTTMYFRTTFLNALFGLDMKFYSRRLQVEIKNSHRLPIYMATRRRLAMQRNLSRVNFAEPDLYFGRKFDPFDGARLDWTGTTRFSGSLFLASRYSLSLGTEMFGGDFSGRVVGTAQLHQSKTQWRGRERFPFFGTPYIRQIIVGDFVSFGLVPREVTGIEVTNRPAAPRHIFSRQVFGGSFDPKIDVSLTGSIEGLQLQQTDDIGNYQLEAPILYGQGLVEVHAFDQWGQEKILQYRMNVPRTLLPAGEVEYSASLARIRPPSNLVTSSNSINWGVTPEMTIGAKVDFYDLVGIPQKTYIGLTGTSRIFSGLVFDGIVVPSGFSRFAFDWIFPSSASVTLTETRFARNAFFNPAKELEEASLNVLLPVTLGSGRFTLAVFGNRAHFPTFRDDELQAAISSAFSIFSPRLSTRVVQRSNYGDGSSTQIQLSSISMGMFLPSGLLGRTELTYNHLSKSLETINADIVKRFPSSFLVGLSYFRIPALESYNFGLRVEYYFPFARTQVGTSTSGGGQYEYSLASSGSVTLGFPNTGFLFDNRPNFVGYGGFILHPFLDANGNGVADPGEATIDKGRIFFSNIDVGGQSRVLTTDNFSNNRITGYEEYNLFLDPQSLDNPIWVPQYNSIRLLSEPNYIKRVDIPVVNGGFIRGTITVSDGAVKPAEGIKVVLTAVSGNGKSLKKIRKETSTFSTGEYEFSAVPPGRYIIEIDAGQVSGLGYSATPLSHDISVVVKPDGDVVADQDFRLNRK